jgi:hypothetical protein
VTLEALIEAKLSEPLPEADPYLPALLPEGEPPLLLFAYGSCLSPRTRTKSSIFDFYVVADRPGPYLSRAFSAGRLQHLAARVLPPSVYHRGSGERRFKACVVTLDQLRRETSEKARDIHHLGRFSKRMALLFARDEAARREAVRLVASALRTLYPHALALPSGDGAAEPFALCMLRLSYLGEQRVAEDDKVRALLDAERDYYTELFAKLREEPPAAMPDAARTRRFLSRSRRRGLYRWPKYVMTVDGWLEILLDKLERHHGVRLELSPRERRWPLIFAWGKYLTLRRKGIVR